MLHITVVQSVVFNCCLGFLGGKVHFLVFIFLLLQVLKLFFKILFIVFPSPSDLVYYLSVSLRLEVVFMVYFTSYYEKR